MRLSRILVFHCFMAILLTVGGAFAQECLELQGQPRFLASAEGRDYQAAVPVAGGRIVGLTPDNQLVVLEQDPAGVPTESHVLALGTGDGWLAAIGQTVFVSGLQGVKVFQVQVDGSLLDQGYLQGQEVAAEIKACEPYLAVIHDGAWSLWDGTDPGSPTLVSRTEFTDSGSSYTQVHLGLGEQFAVVNDQVYDLADPAAPQLLPSLPMTYGVLEGQEVAGSTLYQFLGSYSDGGSWIYGDRWFYRTYSLRVLDLAEPGNYPILADHSFRYSTTWPASAPDVVMGMSGGYVLAGQTNDASLLVIDTSQSPEAEPIRVPVMPAPVMVFKEGQLLGLGTETFAFTLPPTTDSGTVPMPAVGTGNSYAGGGYDSYSLFDMDQRDGFLAVAVGHNSSDGQHYWDEFTNLGLYRMVDGNLETLFLEEMYGQWTQVALGSDHLFLNAYGLYSRDISDPANPGALVSVPGVPTPYGLASLGDDLFAIGDNTGEVAIWNLADPLNPVLRGSCGLGSRVVDFQLEGQVLFTTVTGSPDIQVLDVSNPDIPLLVQTVELPERARAMAGSQGRAVALASVEGRDVLYAFDFSPSGPAESGRAMVSTETSLTLNSLAFFGSQVFLGGYGLHEFDPDGATHVGCLATSHPYLGLVTAGGRLYGVSVNELVDVTEVVCGNQGISAVDQNTPVSLGGVQLAAAPNPFNPRTSFRFNLAQRQSATLVVYDVRGRAVRRLLDAVLPEGPNEVLWDGRGDEGRSLPSGMYFGRLETPTASAVTRVVLIK